MSDNSIIYNIHIFTSNIHSNLFSGKKKKDVAIILRQSTSQWLYVYGIDINILILRKLTQLSLAANITQMFYWYVLSTSSYFP